MYQLYKKPIEKDVPTTTGTFPDYEQQFDLLFLPHDRVNNKVYKYAVVGVDVGSRLCDAEPLTDKRSDNVLNAVLAMYDRGIINFPMDKIKVDDGSEFKSVFAKYFTERNIDVVVAEPNRHRSVALVEARNREIGTYLLKRMTLEELKTGVRNTEWVEYLPQIVKRLNKRYFVKDAHPNMSTEMYCKGKNCCLLQEGQKVRVALDRPINVVSGKPVDKSFRSGDIRFSIDPVKIKMVSLSPDNPPLYALEGKRAWYTIEQLLPVNEEAAISNEVVKEVEKIVSRRKYKNRVQFLVKYKKLAKSHNEWIPRVDLVKLYPDVVKEYESK